jgi:hypothetical protein
MRITSCAMPRPLLTMEVSCDRFEPEAPAELLLLVVVVVAVVAAGAVGATVVVVGLAVAVVGAAGSGWAVRLLTCA